MSTSHWPSETSFLIREQKIKISHQGAEGEPLCWIFWDLTLDTLLFEPQGSIESICSNPGNDEPFFLHVPGSSGPIECIAENSQLSISEGRARCYFQFRPLISGITLKWADKLTSVQAGILNFVRCWFLPFGPKPRYELTYNGWKVEFTSVDERTFSYPKVLSTVEKYKLTHHVRISNEGSVFTCDEASRRLYELNLFLTFCKGAWISTALTSGLDDSGIVVMEEWGTHLLSPEKKLDSWMDLHHGGSMIELFPLFVSKIETPDWDDAIRIALYWYVRSDTNNVGPDGGCIFLQAALERFAWHVLVRDKQSISEDGFKKLTAADQLRLLLSALSIPTDIPHTCKEIVALSIARQWRDAPQAITEIRNRLVHPPKLTKKAAPLPYYEAYVIFKRFLELSILSACGYRGVYANRTIWPRNVGSVEPVPWAT